MITRHISATLFLVALMSFGTVLVTHAQQATTDPLTLTITPNYPAPYQPVTIVPQSTVIDLSASTVTVSVNGAVVSKGSGAEPVYITTGGPGTKSTITVSAVTGGRTYTKSLTVRPQEVSLAVEPLSTTHPFYEGGALTAPSGTLRIVALPDLRTASGAAIPAANLVYTWKNGDQVLQEFSGIGKSVLTASSPVKYRNALITLTVSSQDQVAVAQAGVVVSPSDPILRIYQNDPLLGPLFETALPGEITLSGDEESLRAVPYFFGEKPVVTWLVNGAGNNPGPDITVRANGAGSGTATLGLTAKAPTSAQAMNASLRIKFGAAKSLGIFGL